MAKKNRHIFMIGTAMIGSAFFGFSILGKKKTENEKIDEDNPYLKDAGNPPGISGSMRKTGTSFYMKYGKKTLDKVLSFAGLIVLAPVYGVISIAIYLDDPGPVLFIQKRVGRDKHFIQVHKFRSMKMNTPHDVPTHQLSNPEQYITRVGRILRKYSLDELPQVWDIFTSKMSIVGPRPALWNQEDLVAERERYGANSVMPGLTGWAQINGRDELEIPVKARYDGEYVKKLKKNSLSGIWIDAKCFFGTIKNVFRHEGVVEGGTGAMGSREAQTRSFPDTDTPIGFGSPVEIDRTIQKKVLITGAGSYIGNSFEKYAKEHYRNNFQVDTVDMLGGSWREKNFTGYDAVFHVAGIAHADIGKVSDEKKAEYYQVNTDLAIETAEKAKREGVKQFIFMSSMIIYGDSAPYGQKKIITAETKPRPANFYGDSKWQADKGVRVLADDNFQTAVIRPPLIYGKGSRGNFTALVKIAEKLPLFPDVENQRSMLHIENLCEFLCLLLLTGKGGIFFPQNAEYVKTSDMVKELSRAAGRKMVVTKALKPAVWFAAKMPGKIGKLANKAFGNCCYDKGLSGYEGIEYRVAGFENLFNEKKQKYKALILASVASMIDQFNMDNVRLLLEENYDVHVAANFINSGTISDEKSKELKNKLRNMGVRVFHIPIPREILDYKNIITSYKQAKELCDREQYKIIHCHSPIGGVVARLAAISSRKKGTKVIYTAHGFHFYKGAPVKNWALYYPIEWICAWMTDVLIVINHEDFDRAKRHMHAKRVEYVPGVGIDFSKFDQALHDTEDKRQLLGVQPEEILILSIGELNSNKNHEFVIRALNILKNPKIKYIIAGEGNLKKNLINLARELGVDKQVVLLGYRGDIAELLQASDLFVFPSKREGLSMALMEAISSRVPVVCSKIRGNEDLVEEYMFDVSKVDSLVQILKSLTRSRKTLHEISAESVNWNYEHLKAFSLSNVQGQMRSLYS